MPCAWAVTTGATVSALASCGPIPGKSLSPSEYLVELQDLARRQIRCCHPGLPPRPDVLASATWATDRQIDVREAFEYHRVSSKTRRDRSVCHRALRHDLTHVLPSPNCWDNRGSNKSEEHLFQQKIRFNRHKIAWNPKTGKKVTISARSAMVFMVAQIRQTLLATSRCSGVHPRNRCRVR